MARNLAPVGLLLAALLGCGKDASTPTLRTAESAPAHRWAQTQHRKGDTRVAANATVELGAELFRRMKIGPNDNALISPLSIAIVLSMLAEGAKGPVQKDALALLRAKDPHSNSESLKAILIDALRSPDRGFNCANSIWVGHPVSFQPSFAKSMSATYNATVESRPPGDLAKAVNDWVKRETLGRIDNVVDTPNSQAVAYLVDACTFGAMWRSPFDPAKTADAPFHRADGQDVNVQMMARNGDFETIYDDANKNVWAEFKDSDFGVAFIMPKDVSPQQFLGGLDAAGWSKLVGQRRDEAMVSMPKLKLESRYHLADSLKATYPNLFAVGDFSRLLVPSEGTSISDVFHATRLELDERGVRAAAATAGEATGGVPFDVVLDRPYAIIIYEIRSKAILFMGAIQDPSTP